MAFAETPRFANGVNIINEMDSSRLPKLVSRIAQKLDTEESPFTKEEVDKLSEVLDLERSSILLLLETLKLMIQQAAYYNWKPATFSQHLTNAKLSEEKSDILSQAWQKYGRDIVSRLKKKTLSVNQLEKVGWHLNLGVAQGSKSKLAEANVVFQLETKDDNEDKTNTLLMEFNHDELLGFYNKVVFKDNMYDMLISGNLFFSWN